jgi:hypothetical protein
MPKTSALTTDQAISADVTVDAEIPLEKIKTTNKCQ